MELFITLRGLVLHGLLMLKLLVMIKKIDLYLILIGFLIAGLAITKFQIKSEFFLYSSLSLLVIFRSTKKAFVNLKVFNIILGVLTFIGLISMYYLLRG